MSKLAFVFPGQGSQVVGMGTDLAMRSPAARRVLDVAAEALRGEVDLWSLLRGGTLEELSRTENAQPALLAVSLAAHAALLDREPNLLPSCVAGHSLGEYSALVASGALGLDDAVRVVRARGLLMREAMGDGAGAMAAVIGLPPSVVEEACADVSKAAGAVVAPANYNSPVQTVISGHRAAVQAASDALRELGARRVIRLAVSAAFHCELMAPVRDGLRDVLREVRLSRPRVPIISNVRAAPVEDPDEIRALLVDQVVSPVRWTESVRAMSALGVSRLVELGPGRVLSGLCRGIDGSLDCVNVHTAEDLDSGSRAQRGVLA